MRDEAINHYNVIGANDIIFGFFLLLLETASYLTIFFIAKNCFYFGVEIV